MHDKWSPQGMILERRLGVFTGKMGCIFIHISCTVQLMANESDITLFEQDVINHLNDAGFLLLYGPGSTLFLRSSTSIPSNPICFMTSSVPSSHWVLNKNAPMGLS